MSSTESDRDESSRDTNDLCQSTSRESESKLYCQAGKLSKRCATKTRPVKAPPPAPMTVIKDPADKRSIPRAPAQHKRATTFAAGLADRSFKAPDQEGEQSPGKHASRPVPHVDRELIEEAQRAPQEHDARSLMPAGISNNDAAGVCRSIFATPSDQSRSCGLCPAGNVSPGPHLGLTPTYNHLMNPRLDLQVASDTLVDLSKVVSEADLATRSFDAGQQHDADDFALELLQQMMRTPLPGPMVNRSRDRLLCSLSTSSTLAQPATMPLGARPASSRLLC